MDTPRTVDFSTHDFDRIRILAGDLMGIRLSNAKRDMVYGRLQKRLRQLGIKRFAEYCDLLERPGTDELEHFTNAITTNLTAFFRQSSHFEYLAATVLPARVHTRSAGRRLRLWSAGCSTGEEAFSIAMTVLGQNLRRPAWDVRILATDIDSGVLCRAEQGVYPLAAAERLEARYRHWLRKSCTRHGDQIRMTQPVRDLITFKQLNLLHPWPFHGPFDCIFCRNVVIYFSKDTQRILFNRFAEMLPLGGTLFIGSSEMLYKVSDRFELIGKSIYRRIA